METEGILCLQHRGVPATVTITGSNTGGSFSCIAVTPTPPVLPKVNLWRFSEFSIRILEILRDCGSATNRDFCNKLGKSNNYVKQYLYRLSNKGLIFRDNETWKWFLHDLDNDFFVELDKILYIIYNGNTKVTDKEQKGNTGDTLPIVLPINNTPEIKIEDKKPECRPQKPRKSKQVSLVELFKKVTQEQIERGVVELLASEVENEIVLTLANWYDKTSSEATGRYYKHYGGPLEFADSLGYSMMDVTEALCNLDDKGWIYTVDPKKDKYGRWKIGFTEEFLEKVKQR